MKKTQKNFWFTLVELIVVIAIITTISVSLFSSFWGFLNTTSINNSLEKFRFTLKDLDEKISSNDLFDYKIILKKDRNGFYYYENINFWDKKQKLNTINFETWTWNFYIPAWTSTWIYLYNIYLDWRLLKKDISKANETIEILESGKNFLKNDEVFIKSFFNWERLNNIKLAYFSSKKTTKKSNVILNDIKCSWTSIWNNKLVIKNIWWKKSFLKNWTSSCANPKLIFESEGTELEFLLK
jgi:hypothetical protein